MNILLFLFVVLTAMLLGSSVHMLLTVSNATSEFVEAANITDFIAITYTDDKADETLNDWLKDNESVKDSYIIKDIIITQNMLQFPEDCETFQYDNMLGMECVPTEVNLIYDENNNPMELEDGEIAIPYMLNEKTGLKIGDTITIDAYGARKTFTVAHYAKDAFTGSSMLGFKRLFITEEDFKFFQNQEPSMINTVCVNAAEGSDADELGKQFNQLSVNAFSTMNKSMFSVIYLMEVLVAAIMAIVSVFLIIIAFIILRFTIVFTIQEDYKEIGIMKAIGLKDRVIQSIYMVKYFVISLLGGIVGYACSIPLGKKMIDISCRSMVLGSNSLIDIRSLLAVVLVVVLTVLFCRHCTKKINKVSVIEAIRNGSNGKRFRKDKKVMLSEHKRMGVSNFLAVSDITTNVRRFGILIITFILGTMILLLPINIINTLKDTSMIKMFGQADLDILTVPDNSTDIIYTYSMEQFKEEVKENQEKYQQAGVPVELYLDLTYMSKLYKDDVNDSKTVYTNISYGVDSSEYKMEEGVAPKLGNEVAITKQIAKYYNLVVGDTIHIAVNEQPQEFIITGLYESMINLGESIRVGSDYNPSMEGCTGFNIFGRFTEGGNESEYIKKMEEAVPDYEVKNGIEYVNNMIGDVVSILEGLRIAILVIILIINFIITMLIVRMMLARETAEVAILKSIGFKNKSIRAWQIKRIVYILLLSVVAGTILIALFGSNIAMIVFQVMGITKISLVIKPLEVFLIYPGILVADIMAAVLLSTLDIKRIKVWEVNNQE